MRCASYTVTISCFPPAGSYYLIIADNIEEDDFCVNVYFENRQLLRVPAPVENLTATSFPAFHLLLPVSWAGLG